VSGSTGLRVKNLVPQCRYEECPELAYQYSIRRRVSSTLSTCTGRRRVQYLDHQYTWGNSGSMATIKIFNKLNAFLN
jgi:hypothetical protein